jgi:Protein of unknown function (DUF3037)
MNPVKGHYSIVQYCPDLARRETVNIGVVLLVPERAFLQTRMVADNERVRHFFGTTGDDAKLLSDFKKSFCARIEAEHGRVTTLETFQKFIDTRGNQIQLTEPAFVKVRECREAIDQLFQQLVGGKAKSQKRESFTKSLQTRFVAGNVAELIETNVSISLPILERETKIPFAFQNGAFHLLQPVTFAAGKEEANFNRALKYSMEGKILQEHPDDEYGQLKFNVIGRFASVSDSSIPIVRKVLDESNVRLHLDHDLSGLVDEIRRTGKPRANRA